MIQGNNELQLSSYLCITQRLKCVAANDEIYFSSFAYVVEVLME